MMNRTQNYNLCQWEAADKVQRTDFNEDNRKIEAAILAARKAPCCVYGTYVGNGGTVTVEVILYQMFCRVSVTDDGPGIPEAERAKVFQRFYRSPAAYETEGVGIGLYLARQIAEGQGGYIKVSSRPGQGSCFSLYLPRS